MAHFTDLPPEIRLQIYKYVYQGLCVFPSPGLYVRYLASEECEKAMFENMQQEATGPGLSMTCQFFRKDRLLHQAFYSNAIFCYSASWHWMAMKGFLRENLGNPSHMSRHIANVKDATSPHCGITFNLDDIPLELLPSLKHLYLSSIPEQNSCISSVHDVNGNGQIWCPDCAPSNHSQHFWGGETCASHSKPTPARFADPTRLYNLTLIHEGSQTIVHPSLPNRYVLDNFINYTGAPLGPWDHLEDYEVEGFDVKNKVVHGGFFLHLEWTLVFDNPLDPQSVRAEVNARFSSTDWVLRYEFEGKEYAIPQERPTRYDERKCQFVPADADSEPV